ncbi:cupin domain-containing protein, partial [Streptomyces sp. SID7499]|nr:cupin domain-containing protein [Streptomyces sp. SID7499]
TCSEGYVVVGGSGSVQTLTASGFQETPLTPGALVWFTPGTVHRLVNEDGLRVIVLMQNSGLPEAGDAVLTLPPRCLADPDVYRAAATLPG